MVKLLADVGTGGAAYQDKTLWNLPCKRLQCDESHGDLQIFCIWWVLDRTAITRCKEFRRWETGRARG